MTTYSTILLYSCFYLIAMFIGVCIFFIEYKNHRVAIILLSPFFPIYGAFIVLKVLFYNFFIYIPTDIYKDIKYTCYVVVLYYKRKENKMELHNNLSQWLWMVDYCIKKKLTLPDDDSWALAEYKYKHK